MRQLPGAPELRKRSFPSEPLTFLASGEFAVEATVGGKTFSLVVDTGSSQTYVFDTNFQCQNATGSNVSISECRLAPNLYTPSSTFQLVPNEEIYETFAGGDKITGYVGTEQVSLAGIKVTHKIGVITQGYFEAAANVSGLIGLAYPGLAYMSKDGPPTQPDNAANSTNVVIHNPLFFDMVASGKLAAPQFTMVLDRVTGGSLTLGGIPPVYAKAKFATSPIVMTQRSVNGQLTLDNYYYNIQVSSLSVAGKTTATSFTPLLDTGGKAIIVNNATLAAAAKAFNPPGQLIEGTILVNCSATGPELNVTVSHYKILSEVPMSDPPSPNIQGPTRKF
jgi:hypothetical protein